MPNKHLSPPGAQDSGASHSAATVAVHPEAGRRRLLQGSLGLLAGGGLLGLGGCGGAGDDEGVASVRIVNATADYREATLKVESTTVASALNNGGTVTRYFEVVAGVRKFTLISNTSGSSITTSPTLAKDTPYSLIAYGAASGGGLGFFRLTDTTSAPASSSIKLRLLHLAPGLASLGALALYTSSTSTLDGQTPVATVADYGQAGAEFTTLGAAGYRLRITPEDDPDTLLFDSGSTVNIPAGTVAHLVILPRNSDSYPDLLVLLERSAGGAVVENVLTA